MNAALEPAVAQLVERALEGATESGAPDGWPRLDPTALYGLPGEVVRVLEPHTEADPTAILADFLVSFGNAVSAGPHAFADGAEHPARLDVVVAGKTAKARKGSSRRQVHRVFEQADPKWSSDRVRVALPPVRGS